MTKITVYKDLFIDFDDTLYDTHGGAVLSLEELFRAFDLGRYFPDPHVFYDAYWSANIDLWTRYSREEISRDYLMVERFRRPLSAGQGLVPTEALCRELSNHFLDLCATRPDVVEGAHELMEYLRSRGYRMHLTSNGFHEVQYRKLAACGLAEYFSTVILSEDAGAVKPQPRFFAYALQQSGARRETTLVIGDNPQTDIHGALACGIDALLFNRWNLTAHELPAAPTFIAARLADIMDIL